MVRKNWNFHGDIAQPLEYDARDILGITDRPASKQEFEKFDADAIEYETFAEVLITLIKYVHYEKEIKEVNLFIERITPLLGKGSLDLINLVGKNEIQNIYDEFIRLKVL